MTTTAPPDTTSAAPVRARGVSFVGLVGVELRRMWWRRSTKALLALTLVATGAMIFGTYVATSPETIAAQLDDYEQMAAAFPNEVAECERQQEAARAAGNGDADFGCADMQAPTPEMFGFQNPVGSAIFATLALPGSQFVGLLGLALGATLVAGELTTGSMGTWLTFHPRRLRVGLAKLAAAGGGGALLGGAFLGFAGFGAWVVSRVNRPDDDMAFPDVNPLDEPLAAIALRVLLLVVASGVVGAGLAFVLRHTGAVVGLVAAWVVAVEGVFAHLFLHGEAIAWLPAVNIEAFLERGTVVAIEVCDRAGACGYTERAITFGQGAAYVGVLTVLVAALGLLVFRRRDLA